MFKHLRGKTGKRELAWVFSAVLVWAIYKGDVSMVEAIIWPILAYVSAAAGLHIYQRRDRQEISYEEN